MNIITVDQSEIPKIKDETKIAKYYKDINVLIIN